MKKAPTRRLWREVGGFCEGDSLFDGKVSAATADWCVPARRLRPVGCVLYDFYVLLFSFLLEATASYMAIYGLKSKGLFFFHSLCYYAMWRTWFSRYPSENFRHSTLLIWLWIRKKCKFKKNLGFFKFCQIFLIFSCFLAINDLIFYQFPIFQTMQVGIYIDPVYFMTKFPKLKSREAK